MAFIQFNFIIITVMNVDLLFIFSESLYILPAKYMYIKNINFQIFHINLFRTRFTQSYKW